MVATYVTDTPCGVSPTGKLTNGDPNSGDMAILLSMIK